MSKKLNPTGGHIARTRRSSEDAVVSSRLVQLGRCAEHGWEPEDLYCEDHSTLLCVGCRRNYHGRCASVLPVTDACAKLSKKISAGKTERMLKQVIEQCGVVSAERQRDLKDLDRNKAEAMKSIMATRELIVSKVDKLVQKATTELEKLYLIEKADMADHLRTLKSQSKDLEDKIEGLKNAEKSKLDLPLFLAVQGANAKRRKAVSELAQVHQESHKVNLKFDINASIEKMFPSLNSLGEIAIKVTKYNLIPQDALTQAPSSREFALEEFKIRKHVSRKKGEHVENVYIREPEDVETCWITGLAVLTDSTLVIADNLNNKIKLIGPSRDILNTLSLTSSPFDMTLINQSSVAFSMPDIKHIQFLKVIGKSKMEYDKKIQTPFDCNGLAVCGDLLVVTSITDKRVHLIDFTGKVKWTAGVNSIGENIFDWPWYVSYSQTSGKIYVSDRQNNTISTLDDLGSVLNIKNVKGNGPRGITLDDLGNLYTCFYMTDEIDITSLEYPYDRKIILTKNDGIRHPQAISYDDVKGQLLVTSSDSDYLSVYQMN